MTKDKRAARTVIEDIANFPLTKDAEYDKFGSPVPGSNSYREGYAAWRNQRVAQQWLKDNPPLKRGKG